MKPHIEETIKELNSVINELQSTIRLLTVLGGDHAPAELAPVATAPEAEPLPEPELGRRARRARPTTQALPLKPEFRKAVVRSSPGKRGQYLAAAQNMVTLAAGLSEPFSTNDLAKAAGLENKLKPVYGALYRWTNKQKWVVRVAPDQYRRTKSFPKVAAEASGAAVAAAPGRLTIPGLDQEPVEARLQKARKELADAEANNQQTLASILRVKVAKLERDAA